MDNVVNQVSNVEANGGVVQSQVQTQGANNVPAQQPVVIVQPNHNAQRTFTQDELNAIIGHRMSEKNAKIDELTKQLAEEQKKSGAYLDELNGYKNNDIAAKAGVPEEMREYAIFEAGKLAVNGKSFEDAMKELVAAKSSLFGVSNTNGQPSQPANTPNAGQVQQGVANPAQTVQGQQTNVTNPVQVGTTGSTGVTVVQSAGNPASVNDIDSQVEAFLKENKLI